MACFSIIINCWMIFLSNFFPKEQIKTDLKVNGKRLFIKAFLSCPCLAKTGSDKISGQAECDHKNILGCGE